MLLHSKKYTTTIYSVRMIATELFIVSFLSYILFYTVDLFHQGFFSDYVNFNIIMLVVIISGIVTVLTKSAALMEESNNKNNLNYWQIGIKAAIALFCTAVIYILAKTLGSFAWLISICCGVIILIIIINYPSLKEE